MVDYADYTVDQYFSQRFSLCILDTIRRLQHHNSGIEVGHIIELIRDRFIDGDVTSQVLAAIHDLESAGFVMKEVNGVRTLGPFAKLNLAKTQKQRRLMWKKIEFSLGIENENSKDIIWKQKNIVNF